MIKENQIPQEVSTPRVEICSVCRNGQVVKKQGLEFLKIANIYGLQTALDSKITKNIAGFEGRIPIYLDDGDIDFSSFKIGSFDSAASIGSLTKDGFYTADGSGSGYENSIMGYIAAVLTINDTQIVLSTDRGLWYRTYDAGWSIPSYISVNHFPRPTGVWRTIRLPLEPCIGYSTTLSYIVLTAATSNILTQGLGWYLAVT